MSIEFLNFDTVDGIKNGSNAFDTQFTITNTKKNVNRIFLKSLEMPLSFGNVRASGNFNRIIITFNNGAVSTITLSEKSYDTIDLLYDDINALGVLSNATFTFQSSGNFTSVSMTSSTYTSFSFADTGLIRILGIRPNTVYTSTTIGTSYCNLSLDTYVSLYIEGLGARTTNNNNKQCSFKIPIDVATGIIQYFADNAYFSEYIKVSDSTLELTNLKVLVYDRYGNLLNSNGVDYSFTLGFEINN